VKSRLWAVAVSAMVLVSCGGGTGDSTGATGSPRDGVHSHGSAGAFNTSLVADDIIADVTVDPAKVGDVIIHMEFAPPGGKLQQVMSVTGFLRPIDDEQQVLDLVFQKSGVNHFHYDVSVPSAGEWTIEFDATLADGASVRYATTVVFES